jgi:hypothetical protein
VLTAAVPAGYRATPEYADPTSTWIHSGEPFYGSITSIVVSSGVRQGLLQAMIVADGVAASTVDMCSAAFDARIAPLFGSDSDCRVLVVHGVEVRVSRRHDPMLGDVLLSVRMLDGGLLAVSSMQHRYDFAEPTSRPPDAVHWPTGRAAVAPGLVHQIFTAAQLADIVADRRLLP